MRKPTTKLLAEKNNTTARTIRNWRRQGAPLSDAKAMQTWLAGRRSAPPAIGPTKAPPKPPAPPQKSTKAPPAPPPLKPKAEVVGKLGAPEALRRLEKAEVAAFANLEAALATGNALQVQAARRGYLETTEQLRKADLAITESRRTSSETLSRADVEHFAERAGRALGLLGFELGQGLAGEVARQSEPGAILALLRTAFDNRLRLALAGPEDVVPSWLRRAFTKGAALGPGAEDWVESFATLARAFVATHDASVLEAARRAELENEMNAKLWADGLAALRRGNLDELPGLALDKWNVMRADLGLPPRPRAPTGAEIKRAREMRLAGTLAPDADVPLDP
jgi:hypothetical protein